MSRLTTAIRNALGYLVRTGSTSPTPDAILATAFLTCGKCGHRWIPRVEHLPVKCPACQTRRWGSASLLPPEDATKARALAEAIVANYMRQLPLPATVEEQSPPIAPAPTPTEPDLTPGQKLDGTFTIADAAPDPKPEPTSEPIKKWRVWFNDSTHLDVEATSEGSAQVCAYLNHEGRAVVTTVEQLPD